MTLTDGRALLVYNHVGTRGKRFPLNAAMDIFDPLPDASATRP